MSCHRLTETLLMMLDHVVQRVAKALTLGALV
jgi:hypothetical protein